MTASTSTKKLGKKPKSIERFPYTLRIQAMELATKYGLHLVRDNFHLWAVRLPRKGGSRFDQVWFCMASSYDGLWREAVKTFREEGFDPLLLPYAIDETEDCVTVFDPRTGTERNLDKKDLRSRRGE